MTSPDLFGHRAPEPEPPPRKLPKPHVPMSEETKTKLAAARPTMGDRDHAIAAYATALSAMTGARLANAIHDQIRILTDMRWPTLSPYQRTETLALLSVMAARIKSIDSDPQPQAEEGVTA